MLKHDTLQTGDIQRPELRSRDSATVFDTTGFTQTVQITQKFRQGQFGQLSQGTHANRIQSNTEISIPYSLTIQDGILHRSKIHNFLGRVPRPLWSWVNAFPFH